MALSRHDMRRLNEAYYGVQAACSELSAFCRELVVPSDGTVEEVIEMLTEPAGHDLRTLQRAVGAYIDAVMSLRNYDTLFGADQHRAQQRARMLELVGEIGVFVERMLVKSKTQQSARVNWTRWHARLPSRLVLRLDNRCKTTTETRRPRIRTMFPTRTTTMVKDCWHR
jgi:hypothetical protein